MGYKTLEGDVPAAKMLTHWYIGSRISEETARVNARKKKEQARRGKK